MSTKEIKVVVTILWTVPIDYMNAEEVLKKLREIGEAEIISCEVAPAAERKE